MKLRFNILGVEIASWSLDWEQLHRQADVVTEIEGKATKLAGKVVDKFSNRWMKLWVNK